jgi:hypothetical protein
MMTLGAQPLAYTATFTLISAVYGTTALATTSLTAFVNGIDSGVIKPDTE